MGRLQGRPHGAKVRAEDKPQVGDGLGWAQAVMGRVEGAENRLDSDLF